MEFALNDFVISIAFVIATLEIQIVVLTTDMRSGEKLK